MSSSIRRRAASIALCLGLVAGAAPAASPKDASSAAPKALRVASQEARESVSVTPSSPQS